MVMEIWPRPQSTGTPIIAGAHGKPALSGPGRQIQTSQQTAESRPLAAMGAEVILHPTLTDTVGRDVKLVIARASAAMNQVYFFDINGVGDGGIGRTTVVDPSAMSCTRRRRGRRSCPSRST